MSMRLQLGRVLWVGKIDLEVIMHVSWQINVFVVNDTCQEHVKNMHKNA